MELEKMKDNEWTLLDRQALGVIRLALSRNVAFNIVKEKTTTRLMAALSNMYEKLSASNKVCLIRRLFNLRMTKGASVAKHLNEFNIVVTQLSSISIKFDDEVRALILLSNLPKSWNSIATAVSNSLGKEKLNYNDIQDLILSEEIHRRELEETSGSALNTKARGRSIERNPNRNKSKSKHRSKSRTGKGHSCWNCEKKGHLKGDCPTLNKSNWDQIRRDVTIRLLNGFVWKIQNVRHMPGLKRNLIYVGQLDNEGHVVTSMGSLWKITKGAMVVTHDKKEGTLYTTINNRDAVAVAGEKEDSNLWHQRLGYMSQKGMKVLASKGKLSDLKSVDIDFCEDCIFGKQKKGQFFKGFKETEVRKVGVGSYRCGETKSYDEALQVDDSNKWELAMQDEMDSLMANHMWELSELPRRLDIAYAVGVVSKVIQASSIGRQ
ncbi:uncharacterized protein LOC114297905 [Camellia sinensis]|uniref:uncharacterized protein LOC114297905 n=1 Tax=Camellia sinensis TaxID=4442 RepID=UPI001036219D|nr:uncharacterized protein LOC114297905 [Camellia sinensis]